MSVCRVEHTSDYSVMANYHLDDKRLSLKAKGLLSYMLRLPDDWDYTVAGLQKSTCDGRVAIRSALEELEAAGYISREQTHTEAGTFGGNDYVIRECPIGYAKPDDAPLAQNLQTVPLAQNPPADNMPAENLQQPSTNIPSTKTIPPIAPHRGRERVVKLKTDWKPERFEKFWVYYPLHKSKQAAMRAWDRLKPDDALLAQMARALQVQKASQEWQRGIGIPYCSTYLNGQRWTDEPDAMPEDSSPGGWAEDREVI